jgi:hypothetical protein
VKEIVKGINEKEVEKSAPAQLREKLNEEEKAVFDALSLKKRKVLHGGKMTMTHDGDKQTKTLTFEEQLLKLAA